MTKLQKPVLSLKEFMLRQEVLKLYRDIFRSTHKIPDVKSRKEIQSWARYDFRNNMKEKDEYVIKTNLEQGKRMLKELQTSLNLSGSKIKSNET